MVLPDKSALREICEIDCSSRSHQGGIRLLNAILITITLFEKQMMMG